MKTYHLALDFHTKDADKLFKVIKVEADKKDRSELKIEKKKDKIIFIIDAADATALRASANTVIKILQIIEKAKKL
ncbi:hypothetical protein GOV09_03405 [Candidatus Woesearchaeota archaeon]|nr:hypothetical protein [Candidatus Woesearchaeota archaeon]